MARLAEAARSVVRGELAAARRATEAVLAAHPDRTDALELRAIVALEEQDFEVAERALERALRIEPTAKRKVAWAKAQLGKGSLAEAQAALSEARRLDPTDPTVYEVEAAVLTAMAQLEAALDAADGAVAISPQRAESHACRARVLVALERSDDAVEAYVSAVRASDGDARVRRQTLEALAALHDTRGEADEAETTRSLLAQLT